MMLLRIVITKSIEALVLMLSVFVAVVGYVSALLGRSTTGTLLIMAVKVLDVETASSLVVTKAAHRSCFKALILSPSSALSVKVFSQVVIGRLQLLYDVYSSVPSMESHLAISLIHVINVVLVLMTCQLSSMLVFENLCQNALGACWNTLVIDCVTTAILNTHTSTVNCIKLIFSIGSW